MIWQPGVPSYLFRKPASGGGPSVPVPTVYWEADFGVVTTTNGTTADASPVSGNKVLSWTSKDASASVASFGTNSQRPTYYNYGVGKPFVRFDGQQNQRLTSTGPAATFNNAQAYTMGVAFRAAPIYAPGYRNQQYLTLNNGGANTNTLISQGGGMQFGFWSGNIGQRVLLGNSQQLWGETTYFGTFSTASSTSTPGAQSTKIYTGGTLAASDTTSTAGVSPCLSILIGGADATIGFSTICDYYGVYLYASELNASQISAVHNDISSRMFSWTTIPVAGAALWLDASRPSTLWDTTALGSNVYSNGGAIGQWNDLSGNARHAQQASSANRPTWASPANGQNGLGAIVFNGSSSHVISSGSGPSGSFTAYIAFARTNSTGTQIPLEWGTQSTGNWRSLQNYYGNTTTDGGLYFSGYFRDVSATSLTALYSTCSLMAVSYDGTTTTVRRDGGVVSGTPVLNAISALDVNIGRSVVNNYFLNGKIMEIAIYPTGHNSTQYSQMRSYFQAKWGTP